MFCDEISSCAGRVSGAGHVCSGHDEGHGLIRCKGGHVSNAQLLPALGDHQHQLQIAGTLRGQIGGIREGLRVGVVQRDVGTALHALAVAGSREIGRSCCQCMEVCIHVLLRGHGISGVDLGQILCADVEGLVLGAVDHGDQNSNVFVTGLCRYGINVEQAGQLNAKAVPVADLITDLDIHDGGAAILLAAAQQACCAQSSNGCAGALEEGTAGNAKIAGYSIGGKTGTSEKVDVYDENGEAVDDKIVSFVGIAPMDDPQYIVLVALDTPSTETGYYISGGVMAAPTVRGVLEDILPYLGVSRDYTGVDMSSVEVDMPSLTGMTEQEAKAALQDESLTYELVGSGSTVTGQIPQAGAKLPGNSEVILYMGQEPPEDLVTVPDFTGMTIGQANQAAANAGLYILVKGATEDSGYVTATGQDVEPGTSVVRGSTIRVDFVDHTAQD